MHDRSSRWIHPPSSIHPLRFSARVTRRAVGLRHMRTTGGGATSPGRCFLTRPPVVESRNPGIPPLFPRTQEDLLPGPRFTQPGAVTWRHCKKHAAGTVRTCVPSCSGSGRAHVTSLGGGRHASCPPAAHMQLRASCPTCPSARPYGTPEA